MKRKYIILSIVLLAVVIAFINIDPFGINSAKEGDVLGKADYSAVDTYINNYPITAYSYKDLELISTTDLKNYGFTVESDEASNSLTITTDPTFTSENVNPDKKNTSLKKNTKAFDVLYTETKTFIEDSEIQSFMGNGAILIKLADLESIGRIVYDENTHSLYLYIDELPMKETSKKDAHDKSDSEVSLTPETAAPDTSVPETSEVPSSNTEVNDNPATETTVTTTEKVPETKEPTVTESETPKSEPQKTETTHPPASASAKPIIVLDPGHGKSSRLMSDEEKIAAGYSQHNGQWGEWRHWKNGTADTNCQGSGCNSYGTCWYPITNGDRDTEPALNLRLALRTKHYLENELGYTVRLTRSSDNENPSFSKRVSYCYPGGNLSATPDAAIYVCLHSNAGGGKGSAYIEANGNYTQKWINSQYVSKSNALGKAINNRIVSETSLTSYAGGRIGNLGYMILFNKCPVPAGYMEIGFFDSANDLAILNSEYDSIAKSIAYGIDDYFKN